MERYNSVETFTDRIKEYYNILERLNSSIIDPSIVVSISSEIKSSGREILYEISANARQGSTPFAKYYDDPLRTHNNFEDGELDLRKESAEFRDYLLEALQERKLPARADGLEIFISKKNQ